jgi:Zn-dependent protease
MGETWEMTGKLLGVTFSMNLLLAAFNLLPFPPLDGSAALPLLLSRRVSARYQEIMWSTPMIGLIGILIAWKLFDFIFHPIFLAAVNLIYPGVTYH